MRFPDQNHYICVFVAALVALFYASDTATGQQFDERELLIENLVAYERLLSDFECSLIGNYEHLVKRNDPGSDSGRPRPIMRYTEQHDIVKQGGMLSSQFRKNSEVGDDRQPVEQERLRKFDGIISRAVRGRQVNLREGLAVDSGNFYPHMLFMHDYQYAVPLSVYLRGREAIRAFPGSNWDASEEVEFSIVGTESVDGLHCVVIHADEFRDPTKRRVIGCRLWICKDRSYLPVKFESYTYRWSETVPVGRGEVLEFEKLDDSLWYPARWSRTSFDKDKVQRGGIEEPIWHKNFVLQNFQLHPNYPISFFSEVPIPEGATIYRLNENGDIVEKIRNELPEASSSTGSTGTLGIRFAASLVSFFLLIALFFWLTLK